MKKGWEEKTLGEVSVFSQGIQVDVNLQTEICSPGKVRFLRIIDVTQGNVPPRYINNPGEKYYLKADEIAMVRYGTVGFVCYGFEGVIANNLFKISIKDKSKLRSRFLQYFLKSELFQSHIRKGVGGAALPAIKFGDIKHIMVGIPPLTEQQAIVDYLDAAFAKIDAMKANAEKALGEAKALFQASLKEMLEPKEGWEYKKLGECFISINNGANIKQIKGAKGIPITRIETLSNDKFNRGRMGYADVLDASPYSSYILNDGDILMSHINSMKYLGRAVQYLKNGDETIIHGMNLLRLVPTKDVLSTFLIYQFFTAFFRNQIVSISHQSVNQASFNTTNLKKLKLKVPPLSEQQTIVTTLDTLKSKVDRLQANYEQISAECDALKQAILKQVFE